MSLYRFLTHAAIKADLGKNAYKVFNALLHQTIGFGKDKDNLTDKRVAKISCVRIDRVRPAIQSLLKTGLFDRASSNKYNWQYSIGTKALADYAEMLREKHRQALLKNPNAVQKSVTFFTPALPKNRADLLKSEAISEKETHTDFDLNQFLPYLQQLLQSLTPMQPTPLAVDSVASNTIALQIAEQLSTPFSQLAEGLSEKITNSLSSVLQQALQPINEQFTHTIETINQLSQQSNQRADKSGGGDKNKSQTAQQSSTNKAACASEYANQSNHSQPKSISAKQSEKQNNTSSRADAQNPSANPIAIRLPDLIEKSAYRRCYNALHELNEQQQKEVVYVFNDMQINNKIRSNPTGLFIHLATAAVNETLSLPSDPKKLSNNHSPFAEPNPDHPNIQYGYCQSANPSQTIDNPRPINAKQRKKDQVKAERLAKKQQAHQDLLQYNEDLNQLKTLKQHSKMMNISLEEQAKRYKMEHILEKFPEAC